MIEIKRFIYAIAAVSAAAMLSVACTADWAPEDNPEPEPEPVKAGLKFVLPSGGAKTAWQAGDQIVVHGEYAAKQVVVTLESGDISADGKTATKEVDNLIPYVNKDYTCDLYAAWPAQAVDNLPHCFCYNKFSDSNRELLSAYNQGDTFNFQEVCGSLSFTADQAYDSFVIVSNKKESLGYEFLQVKLTNTEQNFRQYVGDPVLELDVKSGSKTNTVYFPDGTSMAGGVSIKFRKGNEFVKTCKLTDPIVIERAKNLDLGDISAEIKDYVNPFSADVLDLDKDGNANCYVVTAPGKYKFKAVTGNKATAFLEDVADAVVLWETWNNNEDVTANSIVASASYAEDYIIIKMPATLKPGNAVIAARKDDGTIVWSWHIWVPQTEIVAKNYGIYSAAMMDRNLGALVAAPVGETAPVESFGLTYQWGRKDPFPGPAIPGKSSNAKVAGKEIEQAPGDGSGSVSKITLEQSIANPTLLGFSQNGDWITPVTNDLWMDSEKTIYDPCPPGYRVPARDKNQLFHSGDLTAAPNWSESKTLYMFTMGDPVAVFPFAGYRDDYGPGSMTHAYDRAAYWTAYASADGVTGYYVNIRAGSTHKLAEAGKSRAGSIRCVVQ